MKNRITLRVERRINEPVDLFVMRAFAKALPHMTKREILACIGWIHQRGEHEAKGMNDK